MISGKAPTEKYFIVRLAELRDAAEKFLAAHEEHCEGSLGDVQTKLRAVLAMQDCRGQYEEDEKICQSLCAYSDDCKKITELIGKIWNG